MGELILGSPPSWTQSIVLDVFCSACRRGSMKSDLGTTNWRHSGWLKVWPNFRTTLAARLAGAERFGGEAHVVGPAVALIENATTAGRVAPDTNLRRTPTTTKRHCR